VMDLHTLQQMTTAQLDKLFSDSSVGDLPNGRMDGTVLLSAWPESAAVARLIDPTSGKARRSTPPVVSSTIGCQRDARSPRRRRSVRASTTTPTASSLTTPTRQPRTSGTNSDRSRLGSISARRINAGAHSCTSRCRKTYERRRSGFHLLCCFLTVRRETISVTIDSTDGIEDGTPDGGGPHGSSTIGIERLHP
jgi:hypothetical protein